MIVAASTDCYPELSLAEALRKLTDLEYTNVEIAIREQGVQFKPSEITTDLQAAIDICRNTRRLNVIAFTAEIEAEGDEYYEQFTAICKMAKASKVVSITVPSAELGTPFNEEVERLRKLVAIASLEGVVVSIKNEGGRLSGDPDTVRVLCDNVAGLGLTLDPSHFIYGPNAGKDYEKVIKYVCHVQVRDTSKDAFQVMIGQGEVEYGRLVSQLRQIGYNRSLCVSMTEIPGVDQMAEMRKMRLVLESLL